MKFTKQIMIAILFIFAASVIILLLIDLEGISVNIKPVFLSIFNVIFTGLIPVSVALIAMHTYLKNGINNALLFGCGMLAFGLGSISTGIWTYLNAYDNRVLVPIYNICAFLGAVCLLFSALSYERLDQHPDTRPGARTKMTLSFGAIFLIVLSINYLSIHGLLPAFMDANGFTSVRYIVLSMAIAFYFVAALLFWKQYRKLKHNEHFWYALALSMISLGLFGVMVASGVGTVLGWVGRFAQYMGTVYAAISVMSMYKKAESTNAMVDEIMMDFFADGEARYRNLIEASPDSIISISEDYRIFIANTSANRLFGISHSIIRTSFLDILEQPYRDIVKDDLDVYMKSGSSTLIGRTKEMVARDSAGRIFPVEISFAGRARQSKFAVSLIIRDVTERKRLENALKESELQARSLVAELEKTIDNRTQFISVMSHELRNPLASIVLGLSLLDLSKNPEQITKAKAIMERQVRHLSKLVDDLLDLTRITQNKIKLKIERIDLNEIALSAIGDLKPQYEKKGIKLEFKSKAAPLVMNGDPLRIAQVIFNLLTNALKFTHEGGQVRLSLDRHENEAVIVVQDNGVGMSQEDIKDLFKPFVQFEKTLDRSNGGLGLGLSIVKGIVELHGGQVSAFSAGLEQGSEFRVSLPISE